MRKLNASQKKALANLSKAYKAEHRRLPFSSYELPEKEVEKIMNTNLFEDFYSAVDRFLSDQYFNERNNL